jgi:hypothetical protein
MLVATRLQHLDHGARVVEHLRLIRREFRLQSLEKRYGLRGDHVHQRPALRAGKDHRVELLRDLVVRAREDHAAARTAQGLVRRRRHDVGERQRCRIESSRNETRDVRHVDEESTLRRRRRLRETGAQSITREYAEKPAMISFGRCSCASLSTCA